MKILIWIILIALLGLLIWLYFKFIKIPKIKNIVFIDGTLGSGKTYYSVSLAIRLHKKALRRYRLTLLLKPLIILAKRIKDKEYNWVEPEKPLLYSNIPLCNYPFVKINKDLILREKRFAYRSVLLLDEFSLMADQYTYKDRGISERLSLFFKLFRHETRGGYIVINSQSTSDLHYSIKYVLSDYLYIHHRTKVPFFSILQMQEMAYCGDKDGSQIVNVRNEDIERSNRAVIVWNKYYKYFDTYCYSIFTDNAIIVKDELKIDKKDRKNLKNGELVSFKEFKYLKIIEKENKEDENKSKVVE